MTNLSVADAVCVAFPDLQIDAIVAAGFSGHEPWPEVAGRLGRLEADAAAGHALPVDDDPHIASWRAAYRAFGTNPKRQRPSTEALRRRPALLTYRRSRGTSRSGWPPAPRSSRRWANRTPSSTRARAK